MRRVLWSLTTAVILGVFSAPAYGDDTDGWHPVVGLDILTVGNAGKHNVSAAKESCASLIAAGTLTCASSVKTTMAVGVRFGAYLRSGASYIGPTLGYLYGGPTAGKISLTTTPLGTLTQKTVNHTGRLLLEAGRKFPLNDNWALGLGVGVGMALVSEKSTCAESGALVGNCIGSGLAVSVKRGWGTWELSPSATYRSMDFGIRYVGFGRKRFPPWNTFGLFCAWNF